MSPKRSQSGFTLIELLTVIATIMVLAALSISSFSVYRSNAAYAGVATTLRNAVNAASASTINPESLPPAVALTSQTVQGPMTDASARAFLTSFQIGKNMKIQVSYDPTCTTAACTESFVQINHCSGKAYQQWMRFGDGTDVLVESIPGAGCA